MASVEALEKGRKTRKDVILNRRRRRVSVESEVSAGEPSSSPVPAQPSEPESEPVSEPVLESGTVNGKEPLTKGAGLLVGLGEGCWGGEGE